MAGFIGELEVRVVRDDKSGLFELVKPFSFVSDVAGLTFTAPAGFRTDFVSCPRIPFVYDELGNRARKSGTIHDAIYATHPVDRETADRVLREMVLLDGLNEVEADAYYAAVRIGGSSHWS